MSRLLSAASRGGAAVAVFLVVLGVCRWGPVFAEPPVDVRALPAGGAAVLLATAAGLTSRDRRAGPVRRLALALAVALSALAAVVALRPPPSFLLRVDAPGSSTWLPHALLNVSGRDLREWADPRRASLRWQGQLRAPENGTYVFSARGRGQIQMRIDGRPVLVAAGEMLSAEAPVALTRGRHELEADLTAQGPGLRVRVGWTRPGLFGPWRDDVIPPRYLGGDASPWWWRLTDALAFVVAGLLGALVLAVPWDRPRALSSPAAVTRRETLASVLAYAALLAVMSWPLLLDPARLGVTDRPDGRLNAWILAWDVHALTQSPSLLFQAPVFHPLPDALAFSENLVLPAVLSAPALWAGGPVLAYNFVLFTSLVVSGLGVQLLVRRASGDRLAAFVAGAVFAAGAHRWIRLAHLHAQVTLFLPLALLALDRFWERRTLRRALIVGLLLAAQALSSVYLGAITAAALAAAVAVGLFAGLRAPDLARLGAGLALAAVVLFPVARPYFRMRAFQDVEFTLDTVTEYATTLESYAASGTRAYGGITERQLDPERVRDTLFPGLVTLVVGLSGLAAAPRRYRAVFVAASTLAVVVSLGPATPVYRFLHEHFVLVRSVRALSRFSLIPVLGLSVLSGFALSGRRAAVTLGALALMMLESTNAPIRYGTYASPSAAAQWLAGREGAVAYLPLGERDTDVMLDGVAHFRPLVNGDSGFVPRPYSRAMELLEGPLSEEGLRFLRAIGVRHVVVREPTATCLPVAADLGLERVCDVTPGPTAAEVGLGAPAPALFTAGGTVLDLGREEMVSRVSFELANGPWISRPHVSASLDGREWTPVEATASLADATLSLMRDPRHGRGEVRFEGRRARFVRLEASVPVQPGPLGFAP